MKLNSLRNLLILAGALGTATLQGAEAPAGATPGAPAPRPAPIFIRPAGVPAEQKTALFVFLHGSGSSPEECAPIFQPLADAWKCSLYLPRGSTSHGLRMDGGAAYDWNPARDVPALLKAIRALPGINPRGIFLMGFSSGAYLCYPLAFEQPGLFAGVIPFSGSLPEEYRSQKLAAAGPRPPFFIVHGAEDGVVPVARAREAERFLKKQGWPVRLKIVPDGKHLLPENVFDTVKEAVDWFEQSKAPAAGKPASQ